ncbi:class I adenylate-forming enzyme family protein [Micromonospora sp. WMMD956]|uniref:class I adenylate-forming enzyme family protein n=1 Tax=Micromonospora TaxID=1873 RepID=UPI002417097D|nr:class I adenylate-forming enzyme family protein [Micromonospora sp. WMMD956]MDG4818973.1 class I adenylate-forming enzyme family protein [Micromonospora sp. WMMD956]
MSGPPTLAAALAEVAGPHPHRPAVVVGDRTLTYAELLRRAERLAAGLTGRAATVARCAADVAVTVVAATIADVPLLVGDARAADDERDRARSLFRADRLVTGDGDRLTVGRLTVEALTVAGSAGLDGADGSAAGAAGRPGVPRDGGPPAHPGGDGPAGLGLSTSGSEGWPKCVERPWPAVTANARAFAAALELSPGEVVACTTPPHHSYALCGGILTTLLAGGTYVALDQRPGPRTVADAVDGHRVAVLLSVPLLYRWFSTAGLATRHRPRLCVSAGAPLPPEDRRRWAESVGWRIGEHYGTSEHGMLTLDTESVAGSVGRPVAGVTLTVDPVPGPGDVLVACAGPATRVHHAGPPADRAGDTSRPAGDGPQPTGDVGRLDADGRLHLLGRRGGTLNVAGNKVPAAEVEDALRAFPAVRDCAVVGAPGPDGGQEVVAFAETVGELDHRALYAFLHGRLAAYKVPARVVVVDRLPRNVNGKLLRSELLRGLAAGTWR